MSAFSPGELLLHPAPPSKPSHSVGGAGFTPLFLLQFLLKEGPDYPHVGWNGFHNPGLLLSEIKEPSNVISILDHARPSGNTNLWTFVHRPGDATNLNGFGRPAFRHTDTANILFVDGHVHPGGPEIAQVSAEPKFWDPR